MSDRYHILYPLECGPDVRVFLITDRRNGRRKKVLTLLPAPGNGALDAGSVRKLFDRRQRLNHPLLVGVHDLAFRGKRAGLVTDYLSHRLFQGNEWRGWPHPEVLDVSRSLVRLIRFLHGRGFLCGYLKTADLFLGEQDRFCLNLVCPRTAKGARQDSESVRFMAPEVLSFGAPSKRADYYSLGMVLYQLFTGRPPFWDQDRSHVARKQLRIDPERPRALNSEIPEKLEEVIWSLIRKDPSRRLSSLSPVVEALDRCGRGRRDGRRTPGSPRRAGAGRRRIAAEDPSRDRRKKLLGRQEADRSSAGHGGGGVHFPPPELQGVQGEVMTDSFSRQAPGFYLSHLRTLISILKDKTNGKEVPEAALRLTRTCLPHVSGHFYLSHPPEKAPELVVSVGRCRKTGKQMLAASRKQGSSKAGVSTGSRGAIPLACLGISLHGRRRFRGLLYLESSRGGFSEDEVDFLYCVASAMELALSNLLSINAGPVQKNTYLEISDGWRIIGGHPRMKALFRKIRRLAASNVTVLISGETGTGKELVARALHSLGDRSRGVFLPINCSALPRELVESELFGHRRGSFTGALTDKKGLFEAASGGTVFLDEIGSMPVELQARLLRVIQERKIRRIGDNREIAVDVRILTATNQPLEELVRRDAFREDLYHRLCVCLLQVPPLRQRKSDIPLLVASAMRRLNRREGRARQISPEAVALLQDYQFPGNVRELENIVESAYCLCEGSVIGPREISQRLSAPEQSKARGGTSRVRHIVEGLVSGEGNFWSSVRDPFLNRDLSREEVREIIARGLAACEGNYRRLIRHFNLPDRDYKRLLGFLSNHDCKVDFRAFRPASRSGSLPG